MWIFISYMYQRKKFNFKRLLFKVCESFIKKGGDSGLIKICKGFKHTNEDFFAEFSWIVLKNQGGKWGEEIIVPQNH